MPNYIFVCGSGHSGTTLMLAIIDSHPEIAAVPIESGVFHRIKDDDELRAAVAKWPKRFRLPPTPYIAEKTPIHSLHLGRIFALFPDAKALVMVRDGRDAALSSAKRLGDFPRAVRQWKTLNSAWLPFRDDPRVLAVKYEKLVADPETVLRGLCQWLDLPFEPTMLKHHVQERRWWSGEIRPADPTAPLTGENHLINRNWQINQPIFNAVGRWRSDMTAEQQALFCQIAGDLMTELGYDVSSCPVSGQH